MDGVFNKHRFGFASETTIENLNNFSKNPNTLEYVCLAEFVETLVLRETLLTKSRYPQKVCNFHMLRDYQSPCDTYSHRLSLLHNVLIDWLNPIRKLMQKNYRHTFWGHSKRFHPSIETCIRRTPCNI